VPHSPAFERVCSGLEARTRLERLEARGTVRLALKQAGLDPRSVTPAELGVVLERLLPDELSTRGVADAGAVCAALRADLDGLDSSPAGADSPEAVFARFGARG
jgi:hypothetical protein